MKLIFEDNLDIELYWSSDNSRSILESYGVTLC
jgi:hypothetical protein